jgi:hypothetical protein
MCLKCGNCSAEHDILEDDDTVDIWDRKKK